MKKSIAAVLAFSAAYLNLGYHPFPCDAQTQTAQGGLSNVIVEKIVLMPFLMGQLESPNTPIVKPLSKAFTQLVIDSQALPDGTDQVMNRIVGQALNLRFQDRLVSPDIVADAYGDILTDQALDTPRKRAVRLGEAVEANLVMVGTVWRYREKGMLTDVPDSPASVGFALYLIDAKSGARLWRQAFDGTQKALTEDVLGGLKQLGMGLHWLTAEELARYGVKAALRKLPVN